MNQIIADDKIVEITYVLKNNEGEVLDKADKSEPFTYLQGGSQIVPGLEDALAGLKVGDKKNVKVEPADGYGELDENLILTVKKTQFPEDSGLAEGMQFETRGPDGNEMVFTVQSITGDEVCIDGNHPLAGETLHFDIEVLAIRDATSDELEHGHAHGPHGHSHDHDHGDHEHGEGCDHDHGDGSDDSGHSH